MAAAVVGVPAVPAFAGIEHCPEGVAEVQGTNPTYAQVDTWLAAAADTHDVPLAILRVLAYKESTWRQFAADGGPLVSGDDEACGLGLMQVTGKDRADAVELASDGAYNAMEGAEILRAKWEISASTPPPTGYAPDDPDVIENWYYAICLYNGCGSDETYPDATGRLLSDPFQWLPDVTSLRQYLRPAGFTTPGEAKEGYQLPNAFQARSTASGGEFVFYNHETGVVSEVIPARVHRVSAPPVVSYAASSTGPDGPNVSCAGCEFWRLAEGVGRTGRAHWTWSIAGGPVARVDWTSFGVGAGTWRVDAFVPSLGADMLGRATYTFSEGPPVTIDQNARKGGWVTLTQRSFAEPPRVSLGDTSDVADRKIVADAVRVVPVPTLTLKRVTPETQSYGNYVRLYLTLRYSNGDGVRYRYVTLYRRPLGATAWQAIQTLRTSDMGAAGTVLTAERNVEYTARFVPASGDYLTSAASGTVRQYVAPRVGIAVSDTTPVSGRAVTIRTSVAPNHAGHTVQFQRWISGTGWRTVAYARLDSYGRAAWTFTAAWGGPCGTTSAQRYRVYKPADHDHVAGASAPVDLRVSARCG